jgi:hypothetical protein
MITPASSGDWFQAIAMAGAVGGFVAAFASMFREEPAPVASAQARGRQPAPALVAPDVTVRQLGLEPVH